MREQERDLLMSYILRQLSDYEYAERELLQRIKYLRSDSLDLLELMIAKERLNMFREFSSNVMHILHIYDKKGSDTNVE